MSESQQELQSVLYSVHEELRRKRSQSKDDHEWEKTWKEHTSDLKTLQEYSRAMHNLATKIWEPRNTIADNSNHHSNFLSTSSLKSEKIKCRLEWVVHCCKDYFKSKFEAVGEVKLNLLDVGSCYNPFSKFENYFDIIAVDLCPAPGFEGQIFQCDFLELNVVEVDEWKCDKNVAAKAREVIFTENGKYESIRELPENRFDVVVFSYFLEYLADPKQRVESCRKAYKLLRASGLLFILRPDSSRVTPGGNSALIKKMKVGMAFLGFKRIYFEKLEHLWCMAFKKLDEDEKLVLMQSSYFKKDVQKVGVEFACLDSSRIHELFCICQDFKHDTKNEPMVDDYSNDVRSSVRSVSHCDQRLLEELPNFEVSHHFNQSMIHLD